MRRALLALVFVLAAAHCRRSPEEPTAPGDAGGTESPSLSRPTAVGAPVESAEASSVADAGGRSDARAFCDDAFGADAERLRAKCNAADLAVSQAVARAAADLCSGDFGSALSRSRATFDASVARQCVEMLRTKAMTQSSEDDTFFLHPPCDRVLAGIQPEGGACRFSVECADGLACVGYRPGADGACKKPPRAGEPCSFQVYATILNAPAAALHHPPCARGAWCDGAVCQRRAAAGTSCKANDVCAEGLACVRGKCGPRGASGAACAISADCAFGLWCDRTVDGGAGKCAEKRAEAQPCAAFDACRGRCDAPNFSDAGGVPIGVCASVCGSG
jgi:hypothetical protein